MIIFKKEGKGVNNGKLWYFRTKFNEKYTRV